MTVAAKKQPRKKEARGPDPRTLLAWYDRHARVLPWRARNGERSDPYKVWLSEIMLQQTTVKAVAPYYAKFLRQWPTVEKLAAKMDDVLRAWAGLGYYARARNLHKCALMVAEKYGGKFPDTEPALRELPGIGAYTAAMVASIAFARPSVAIDGNIERVVSRLFRVEQELPGAKPEIRRRLDCMSPHARHGDFAQAMMDLGATICTPKSPTCSLCPWMDECEARKRGHPETFPRKARKREGALRRGAAFVVLREDGRILLRTRPENGLLGGMSEIPGSEWSADFNPANAKAVAPRFDTKVAWQRRIGAVMHVFTHFPLELTVFVGEVPRGAVAPPGGRWVKLSAVAEEALPNVMRKAIAHGLGIDRGENNAKRRAR